jgi:hypothetical protein
LSFEPELVTATSGTGHRIGGVSSVVTGNDVDSNWVVSEGEVVFPLTSAMAKRGPVVRGGESVKVDGRVIAKSKATSTPFFV